jgi:hypothetical protein
VNLLIAKAFQDFEAIQDRKHNIEQDQVIAAGEGAGQPRHSVVNGGKTEIMSREKLGHQIAESDVIVDQENRSRIALGIGRLVPHLRLNPA